VTEKLKSWNASSLPKIQILSSTKTKTRDQHQLRLRVFAGPNGSGKSTVIKDVREYTSYGKPIDFGYYINADDIAASLRNKGISFWDFDIFVTNREFKSIALESGLIGEAFDKASFEESYSLRKNMLKLKARAADERLAQVIADFLRKKLLKEKKRFSFETVFSHSSKLDIMRKAQEEGYKVYLYFVSTESPVINAFRVAARKEKGGHDVPKDKIESRYYRSLDLLYDACQLSYQAFFFDNSVDGTRSRMFAHFKKTGDKKVWDKMNKKEIPNWFRKYYSKKVRP
jgi:predicted ABC-type ATPase